MSNILKIAGAGVSAAAEETDEYFNQTVLLLHGDGTDGTRNNTFLDSTGTHTVVRNPTDGPNAPTQGTFSPFSLPDGRWSVYFGGDENGTRLSCGSHQIGTSDFQVEAWIWVEDYEHFYGIFATNEYNTNTSFSWRVTSSTGLLTAFVGNGTTYQINSASAVPTNQWVHVVFMRQSGTAKMYINGDLEADTEDWSAANIGNGSASTHLIGTYKSNDPYYEFHGWISNLRFIIGTPTYSSNFTPSTEPLTTTSQGATASEVKVLACQSNRFVDNSDTPNTIIPYDDVKVTPFSPFAPTAAYDPAVNGGSGYFDGTGDYLSVADNAALEIGASSFCIEGWIYLDALPASGSLYTFLGKWNAANELSYIFQIQNNSGTMRFAFSYSTNGSAAIDVFQNAAVTANAWHHIAVTRDSTTLRFFLDGVQQGSNQTLDATFDDGTSAINIGRNGAADSNFIKGYVSNARLVIGSAVHTSGFTPSGPLTNITNTALLLNFTNAGIFDNTGKNNLETVADAQIDTTTKKFGTGSMEFDGTGDYLLSAGKPENNLNIGNFTLEFWVYLNNLSADQDPIGCGNTSTTGYQVRIKATTGYVQFLVVGGASITTTTGIAATTWTHVAIVRSGTTVTIYLDGVDAGGSGTVANSGVVTTEPLVIGLNRLLSVNPLNGFIDDLRITNGVARTITVPTKAYPDL